MRIALKPKRLIANSGYGSEENYDYCEKEAIEANVKYNTFDKEQTKVWKKQIGKLENMTYDEEQSNARKYVRGGQQKKEK